MNRIAQNVNHSKHFEKKNDYSLGCFEVPGFWFLSMFCKRKWINFAVAYYDTLNLNTCCRRVKLLWFHRLAKDECTEKKIFKSGNNIVTRNNEINYTEMILFGNGSSLLSKHWLNFKRSPPKWAYVIQTRMEFLHMDVFWWYLIIIKRIQNVAIRHETLFFVKNWIETQFWKIHLFLICANILQYVFQFRWSFY